MVIKQFVPAPAQIRGPQLVRIESLEDSRKPQPTKAEQLKGEAKSRITSFYCGVFLWLLVKGELNFRIIPTIEMRRPDTQLLKAPGGKNRKGETYEACIIREFREELADNRKAEIVLPEYLEVYQLPMPDEEHEDGTHLKKFYLISEKEFLEQNPEFLFRTEEDVEDCEDILRPPALFDVVDLAKGQIYKSHLHAMAQAILKLAEDPDLFDILSPLLDWAQLPTHLDGRRPIYFQQ